MNAKTYINGYWVDIVSDGGSILESITVRAQLYTTIMLMCSSAATTFLLLLCYNVDFKFYIFYRQKLMA